MRSLDPAFVTEKNKPANRPIYLYSIIDYDGSLNDLNYAEWDTTVSFDGVVYTPFPITHEFVGENTQGEVDAVKITVSNVSRVVQAYLEQYDLRGKKVVIKMVFADQLADADVVRTDTFYIDSYTADAEKVEFSLSSKFDVLNIELPVRRYMRNYCSWKFKSTECGYAGGETECNKTLQRCRALTNQVRYGGFPSIPSNRVFTG